MAIKVSELLEKYRELEQRSDALRLQMAKDEARRENDQRQYDEIIAQLRAMFKTDDLNVIRETIEQEKAAVLAELEAYERTLNEIQTQQEARQKALAEIDMQAASQ